MTSSRRKLREFWIDPTPDNAEELANELDTAIYIAMDKHPRQGPLQWQSNLINVREVSPELDKAIEGLVKALKDISGDLNEDPESIALDSAPSEALKHSIQVARYALEELERVNG